jgi:hypothetical protein
MTVPCKYSVQSDNGVGDIVIQHFAIEETPKTEMNWLIEMRFWPIWVSRESGSKRANSNASKACSGLRAMNCDIGDFPWIAQNERKPVIG